MSLMRWLCDRAGQGSMELVEKEVITSTCWTDFWREGAWCPWPRSDFYGGQWATTYYPAGAYRIEAPHRIDFGVTVDTYPWPLLEDKPKRPWWKLWP